MKNLIFTFFIQNYEMTLVITILQAISIFMLVALGKMEIFQIDHFMLSILSKMRHFCARLQREICLKIPETVIFCDFEIFAKS